MKTLLPQKRKYELSAAEEGNVHLSHKFCFQYSGTQPRQCPDVDSADNAKAQGRCHKSAGTFHLRQQKDCLTKRRSPHLPFHPFYSSVKSFEYKVCTFPGASIPPCRPLKIIVLPQGGKKPVAGSIISYSRWC